MKKLFFILASVVMLFTACEKSEPDLPGLELGTYTAQTQDGPLFAELVSEECVKLYFYGGVANAWMCRIEGDTISINGRTYATSRRPGSEGKEILYLFTFKPGKITSRKSFEVEASVPEEFGGPVLCVFTKN